MIKDNCCSNVNDRWLQEKEVAEITGLSVHTLRAHRLKRKGIAYCKIGRSVRYSLKDVKNFMETNRISMD